MSYKDQNQIEWSDYLLHAAQPKPDTDNGIRYSSHRTDSEFSTKANTDSFAAAAELAKNGWEAGTAGAESMAKKFTATVTEKLIQPVRKKAVSGGRVHYCRFRRGRPDCMLRLAKEEGAARTGGRLIRLLVEFGTGYGTSAATITRRGAAVLAAVRIMETSGYGVEVTAICSTECDAHKDFTQIKIKSAGDVEDSDRLAFVLSHPSMLRRIHFRHMESWSLAKREAFHVGTGYGSSTKPPQSVVSQYSTYIPAITSNLEFSSDEKTEAWIKTILEAQGIALMD